MVLALAILLLIAGGLVLGEMQTASLNDFIWLQDAPAAANPLPGQGS